MGLGKQKQPKSWAYQCERCDGWLAKWEQEGLAAINQDQRADKGKHRIAPDWQDFILKTYKEGNKGSKRITPAQVAIRVQARAQELGEEDYPSYRTVYRVLDGWLL
jgi:putative transposase